jgi:hypothetical protein
LADTQGDEDNNEDTTMYFFDPVGELTLIRFEQDQLDRRLNLLRLLNSGATESRERPVLVRLIDSLTGATRRLRRTNAPRSSLPTSIETAPDSSCADSDELAA